ncbi:MAG TPA: hypothetical protein PKW44_02195 [Methylophilaceae bacterium]|nr:hypothetical protein [Methylophilaceae bacterium]HQR61119.1 hypothetical protein [Methylophilaceae bacterium]
MEPTKQRRWARWLIPLAIAPLVLFTLYTWLVLNWSYSSGERAGYVQQFSKKGWLCKTWEGELAMVTMPGTLTEKFRFTIRDDAVAAKINQTLGKKVSLTYEQHLGVPTSCFGDTEYFVADVRLIQEELHINNKAGAANAEPAPVVPPTP